MKKQSNLKVVKGPSTKVGKGISEQFLPNHYNLKSLNKEYINTSSKLLVAILEILGTKQEMEIENTLCRFIEGIGLGKSPLSYFLQILIDKPLLRFMAINQLQKLSYESQLKILNVMGQHWSEDMLIINKLSHLADAAHSWSLEHKKALFNNTLTAETILKYLMHDTDDIPELRVKTDLFSLDYCQIAVH